ncbi:MAG: hypothetical protein NWE78_01570 [Candidatus Bathyarchaeota archaeon]|nr:hypothetical protein [Candidatus Bathyarchaeota archaeon]
MESKKDENWYGLLSFGVFIVLFALFFVIVPNYWSLVEKFLGDFKFEEVASNVVFPVPQSTHPVVYETIMSFCVVFGLFQFVVLALRLYFRSRVNKVAETVSNIVIWLGAAYMFNLLRLKPVDFWFPFLGGLIVVFGVSLIVRSVVTLLPWRR